MTTQPLRPELSILIPTWNNLDYLRWCLDSIDRHCRTQPEIIVHINDGGDGTAEWVAQQGLLHTRSASNIGICTAMNLARTRARGRHLLYLNDDMYVGPGLDQRLLDKAAELAAAGHAHYMISGTMVEARDSGNRCAVVADYGDSPANFAESRFLADQAQLARGHWNGSSWPPVLIPASTWDLVGGFSIEFSPGMYSDPDLAMKLWQVGCREFVGLGDALVYHLPSRSTGRVRKNNGRRQFLRKWGVTAAHFSRLWLRRGEPYTGALPEPDPQARQWAERLDGLKLRWL